MLENIPNIRKPMNRLKIVILLLTVLTVSYLAEYHLLELIQ